MKEKKPIIFLVFKIVGILGLGAAIAGIVLAIRGFGDFESENYMIGALLAAFGLLVGVSCTVIGFRPEIAKLSARSARYIQQENKAELTDIAVTSAEIAAGAVEKTAEAVASGLAQDKACCKQCGASIEAGSSFCNHCGAKQDDEQVGSK